MTNEIKEILDIFYNEYPKEEKQLEDYITNLQQRIDKTIKKLESIRAFGLRSGKTLFSVLINESIEILKGDE